MHTSVAPRSHASRARRTISSSRQEVALFLAVVAAERAEGAVLDADVGEVDVAVDHVGDDVADLLGAQLVGGGGDRGDVARRRRGAQHLSASFGSSSSPARHDRESRIVRGRRSPLPPSFSASGFTSPSGPVERFGALPHSHRPRKPGSSTMYSGYTPSRSRSS